MMIALQGCESLPKDLTAAEDCVRLFSRFEGKGPATILEQGSEPPDFRRAFKMQMQRPPLVPNVGLPFWQQKLSLSYME